MHALQSCDFAASQNDDPAHYRWSSYRVNALGQEDALITPHLLYTDIVVDEAIRQTNYRSLFRHALDAEALSDIRRALGQWATPGLWTPPSK